MLDAHRFDIVYHLAAEYSRWNGEDYHENLWQTNCIGTKNLLRLQEKHGFKLVFFSSAEVYGDYTGTMTEGIMEKNQIKDTYQMNDYAACATAKKYFLRSRELSRKHRGLIWKMSSCNLLG